MAKSAADQEDHVGGALSGRPDPHCSPTAKAQKPQPCSVSQPHPRSTAAANMDLLLSQDSSGDSSEAHDALLSSGCWGCQVLLASPTASGCIHVGHPYFLPHAHERFTEKCCQHPEELPHSGISVLTPLSVKT